jgi:hypothetical protein
LTPEVTDFRENVILAVHADQKEIIKIKTLCGKRLEGGLSPDLPGGWQKNERQMFRQRNDKAHNQSANRFGRVNQPLKNEAALPLCGAKGAGCAPRTRRAKSGVAQPTPAR